MKILLASPGTGKTTKVKKLIADDYAGATTINVISFTNATVNDLTEDLAHFPNVACSTLHSFAFRLNHLPEVHVIENKNEEKAISSFAQKLNVGFAQFCSMIQCITFDGMIQSCVSFMKANPAYAEARIGRMDLLVVDEFQDFNPVEQELVMLLSGLAGETIILGDDDQSIYGFKDADPDGIISLHNTASIQKLDHENICYRCPDEVVHYGKKLIHQNTNRIDKEWHTSGNDGKVIFKQLMTQAECDDYIQNVVKHIRSIDKDASVLILSQLGIVVESLKTMFPVDGILLNDCWSDGWDKEVLSRVWWLNAIYGKIKLPFVLCLLKHYGYSSRANLIRHLQTIFQVGFHPMTLVSELMDLDLLPQPFASYVHSNPPLADLYSSHPEYAQFAPYIDDQNLYATIASLGRNYMSPSGFKKGEVNAMSIYKSKGLQAEYVIIAGLVNGILPNKSRGLDSIEAQRRLLYVGMTRAKKMLFLVSTVEWKGRDLRSNYADLEQFAFNKYKRLYSGKTSVFVEEIQK